ncbi:hypothetical protein C490_03078 [Natronobacterium gregoryi SP2]|uniref:Uncharacterized protein n=4 Tax=Natronobacterium gregoryi TaxID=44930 RepID=L9YHX7_NATGS|nr:hypothetical protein C490_03078 [Natronobacterium gregoryi SP2]
MAVTFALVMALSMFTMPLMGGFSGIGDSSESINAHSGTAVADDDDGVCDNSYAWIVGGGAMMGAYCVASSYLDDPDEASDAFELEQAAYNHHASLDQMWAELRGDMADDRHEDLAYFAFADGEQEVVEHRYEDEPLSEAEVAANNAILDYFNSTYRNFVGDLEHEDVGAHNEFWSEYHNWDQATSEADNADNIYDIQISQTTYHRGTATLYRGQMDVTVDVTGDSELVTDTMTTEAGEELEYITAIEDVEMTDDDPGFADPWDNTGDTDATERTDLVFQIDPDKQHENGVYATLYHYEDADADALSEPDTTSIAETGSDDSYSVSIVAEDPNSSESSETTVSTLDNNLRTHLEYVQEERIEAVEMMSDRPEEYYDNVDAGEKAPDEYFGPREFVTEYGSAMGTQAAVDLYFERMTGASVTDPDQQMVVEEDGDEYTGGLVMTNPDDAPRLNADEPQDLADSEGEVSLTDYQHRDEMEFEDGVLEIEFEDSSGYDTEEIGVDVINADEDAVSIDTDGDIITVEVDEDGLQDDEFALFESFVEFDDDGETVTESSDTYMLVADDRLTDVYGFQTGEEYDVGADMIYQDDAEETDRVTLDDGWTLEEAYGDSGDEVDVVPVDEGVDTSYDGVTIVDRIDDTQDIRDAVEHNDHISAGGDDDGWGLWEGLGLGAGVVIVFVFIGGVLLTIGYVVFRAHPTT